MLLKEARTLAALAHPNIVPIYDAGLHEGTVFIAMEYVPSANLTAWLAQRRSVAEIVGVFSQIARGLAAAHRAGLVHRDVKPDNVLFTADGRAMITDFGLVAGAGETPTFGGDDGPIASSGTSRTAPAISGRVPVGTPAYMAPEQIRGDKVDGRADQFSLSVALFEALYRARPFFGRTVPDLLARIERGERVPVPASKRVPPRLAAVVERGLRPDPAERWPDMDALREALNQAIQVRRRGPLILAGAGALALAGGVALTAEGGETRQCTGATARLDGVWDEPTRAAIEQRIAAGDLKYAANVQRRIEGELDGYAEAWTRQFERACEAARADGPDAQRLLDERMACLERARTHFAAFTAVLGKAEARSLARFSDVDTLVSPTRCFDVDTLGADVEPPLPQEREDVERVRGWLAKASAMVSLAEADAANALLDRARVTTARLQYVPLRAELALAEANRVHRKGDLPESEVALHEALRVGTETGHRDIIFQAALGLMFLVGYEQRRVEDGLRFADIAGGLAERVPYRQARFKGNLALVYRVAGRLAEAEELLRETLAYRVENDPDRVADVRTGLATVLFGQGRYEEAAREHGLALEELERVWGDGHPATAGSHNNIAGALHELGDTEGAAEHLRVAIRLWTRMHGAEHPHVATARDNLGLMLRDLRKPAEAEREHRAALEIRKKRLRPRHPHIPTNRINIAAALFAQGRLDEAEAELRPAIEAHEEAIGHASPLGRPLLAEILTAQGRFAETEAVLARALEIAEAETDPSEAALSELRKLLAEAKRKRSDR